MRPGGSGAAPSRSGVRGGWRAALGWQLSPNPRPAESAGRLPPCARVSEGVARLRPAHTQGVASGELS